jgi:hypothetical protein
VRLRSHWRVGDFLGGIPGTPVRVCTQLNSQCYQPWIERVNRLVVQVKSAQYLTVSTIQHRLSTSGIRDSRLNLRG